MNIGKTTYNQWKNEALEIVAERLGWIFDETPRKLLTPTCDYVKLLVTVGRYGKE